MNKTKAFQLFLLLIIVLTMYNNLEHSAKVYYLISANSDYPAWYNHLQSFLVVIVIDLSIIAFIITAKHKESIVFAWILFFINCIFFNIISTTFNIFNYTSKTSMLVSLNQLFSKLIYSSIFSYSIHRFSYLWFESTHKEYKESSTEQDNLNEKLDIRNKEFSQLEADNRNLLEKINNNHVTFKSIKEDLNITKAELIREKLKHVKSTRVRAELENKLSLLSKE